MRTFARRAFVGVGLGSLTLGIVLASTRPATATSGPTSVNVMNVPFVRVAEEPVELVAAGTWIFSRVLPDGTAVPGEFVVPAGKVLVIKDMSWEDLAYVDGSSCFWIQGYVADGRLWGKYHACAEPMATDPTKAFFRDHLSSGLVFGEGMSPRLTIVGDVADSTMRLNGYLVPVSP